VWVGAAESQRIFGPVETVTAASNLSLDEGVGEQRTPHQGVFHDSSR
jgi:hypothetical protein